MYFLFIKIELYRSHILSRLERDSVKYLNGKILKTTYKSQDDLR